MARALLVVALGVALLQVGVGASMLALSSFVGEVREEGVVTDYHLHPYHTVVVASAVAGGFLAAAALLLTRRRRTVAAAGVVVGALPGIWYGWLPLVVPALLLPPVGLLAIWVSHRSGHTHPASV